MKIRAEINQQRQKINKAKRWCLERSIKLSWKHIPTKNKIYSTHCIYIFVHTQSVCVCVCKIIRKRYYQLQMRGKGGSGGRTVKWKIKFQRNIIFCQFLRKLTRREKPQTGKLGMKGELLITAETEVYTMKNFMFYFWCTPHQLTNTHKNYLKRLTQSIWILT